MIASDGLKKPVSLLSVDDVPVGEQVVDPELATTMRKMMTHVTQTGGTATRAAISSYDVAGKTGTVHKVGKFGYEKHRYVSMFAGMVPADNPRLVTVVVINDPRGDDYFGGAVAAPVFSEVTADALRMLKIPPSLENIQQEVVLNNRQPGDAT